MRLRFFCWRQNSQNFSSSSPELYSRFFRLHEEAQLNRPVLWCLKQKLYAALAIVL